MLQPSTLALNYTSMQPFLWYCSALFPPSWLCASRKSSVHISLTFRDTRMISSSSLHLLMWIWSLPHQKCRWSSLICSAPMNWSHTLLLSVMQIFGGSIFSWPSIFLGWWIMRWGLWLHLAALIAVSSCSPGWSWPNESPGPSSQMVIWMTCCCYLFHLLVRRSSIKFHIDWFHIVNCVFYSNKCISEVQPCSFDFSFCCTLTSKGWPPLL